MSPWQTWGADHARAVRRWCSWCSCSTRSATGCGSRAIRRATSQLFDDPIFCASVVNTLVFLIVGINVKMVVALFLSGFFVDRAHVDQVAVAAVHPAVGGAVDPDHPLAPLHAEPGVGRHQPAHLQAHRRGRPELAQRSAGSRSRMAMLVHIWKSLPFWTLILIAGRLAIPQELYEAASVDGATRWQKFKFITWPSMRTLYLTSHHPVDDLDARRLQQRLPADRRRTGRPHARARHARHPLPAARPGRPVDGGDRRARCRWCCRWCTS